MMQVVDEQFKLNPTIHHSQTQTLSRYSSGLSKNIRSVYLYLSRYRKRTFAKISSPSTIHITINHSQFTIYEYKLCERYLKEIRNLYLYLPRYRKQTFAKIPSSKLKV